MTDDWARPVVHFEIRATDPATLGDFYAAMFNWDLPEGPVRMIPAGIGGPESGVGGHVRAADRGGVTLFVQVRSLEESLERAERLGASIVNRHIQIPGGATLAAIEDPEGNPLTLVQQ